MPRIDIRMSDEDFQELTRQAKKNKRTKPSQVKYLIEQERLRNKSCK